MKSQSKNNQRGVRKNLNRNRAGMRNYENPNLAIGGNTIPKSVSQIMPDRLRTRLSYNGLDIITIATGQSTISRRWIPTGLWDVDPLLGSTSTVGFSELSLFYAAYRVHSSRFKIRIIPNAANGVPCMLIIIPLNQDPGGSPSATTIQEWVNNAYNQHTLCGGYGSPPVSVTQQMSTRKLYGSEMVSYDDNFASLVTTNPVNNWYWAVGLQVATVLGASQIYTIEISIEMDADFYDRKSMNS